MKRKKKLYSRPRKLYEKSRIEEENELVKTYALKNKKEIWKTLAKVNYYRNRAKSLASLPLENQEVLFVKLRALGLKTNMTSDVLDLQVEDLLKRRLPTIVANKKMANTLKHARQLVVHKKILINNKVINSPSYLVKVAEESLISLKQKVKKPKIKAEIKVGGKDSGGVEESSKAEDKIEEEKEIKETLKAEKTREEKE